MKLSVVVCTYRRFDWLGRCLSSLRNQTLHPDQFAILVVDNSLLRHESASFRDSLQGFNTLEYIITEQSGLSMARNLGLEACKTPYIAYIDDDACAHSNWAEEILKAFECHLGAGAIGGRVLPIWETSKPDWLEGPLLHCQAILDWGEEDLFISGEDKWLVGANVSYRAEALRNVGGFPSFLGRQGPLLLCHEELSVNMALQGLGYDILYSPNVVVEHLIQAQRMTQEWLFRQKYWEGASRVLLERFDPAIDVVSLANKLEPEVAQSIKNLSALEDHSAIEMRARQFQAMGRKSCLDLVTVEGTAPRSQRPQRDQTKVFHIVTPSLNAVDTIDQTILSVLSQAGDFSIRYHIQDGCSTDDTVECLLSWQHRLAEGAFPFQCNNVVFTFSTESDRGVYEAITKGFAKMGIPPQGYMTWINADDILMPGALASVQAVATQLVTQHVNWLGGAVAVFKDDKPIFLGDRPLPTALIKSGLCDGRHWDFVQQEGSFFSNELWLKVGAPEVIRNYKYAGDYHLWRLFAHHENYYQLLWPLGAFRLRDGQISQKHSDAYQGEIDAVLNSEVRFEALKAAASEDITRLVLRADYATGLFRSEEEHVTKQVARTLSRFSKSSPLEGDVTEQAEALISSPAGDHPPADPSEGPPAPFTDSTEIPVPHREAHTALGQEDARQSEHIQITDADVKGPDPNRIVFGTGWHPLEGDGLGWWRWSWAIGYVHLKSATGGTSRLSFTLRSAKSNNHVCLRLNGIEEHAAKFGNEFEMPVCLEIPIRHGTNILEFSSENDPLTTTRDPRPLNFMLKDLEFRPPKKRTIARRVRKAIRKIEQSGLFYVPFYLTLVPEIQDGALSPIEHYVRYGAWENKDPNPLFSSAYYLGKNRDAYISGDNPLLHYIERGATDGRDPHPAFSTRRYFAKYPEVEEAGMNPLFHYLRYGILEGRNRDLASRIDPNNFQPFTYAKRSHWDYFQDLQVQYLGRELDMDKEPLKYYQDLLVYAFIYDHIPLGSRILDVGGGNSRILKHFAKTYECWNIDKLEGIGNGPHDPHNLPCRLVRDYMGNFNAELQNSYFDFVFSISALKHTPQDDPGRFDRIIDDINRVLKPDAYSLHLFDITLGTNKSWINSLVPRIFNRVKTLNSFVPVKTMQSDPDLFVMSEEAYNKYWYPYSKKSYLEFGRPSSLNILWRKSQNWGADQS